MSAEMPPGARGRRRYHHGRDRPPPPPVGVRAFVVRLSDPCPACGGPTLSPADLSLAWCDACQSVTRGDGRWLPE